MTAGTTPRASRSAASDSTNAIRPPWGKQSRRPLFLVASLALVCGSIAAFAGLYASADHKVPAVIVVRPLAQGQLITQADLGVADVALSSSVAFVPLDQAALLAGKRAAAAIPSGSLLTPADATSAPSIARGSAVVGIALKQGSFPAAGLSPGDLVMVVQTAGAGVVIAAPPSPGTVTNGGGALTSGGALVSGGASGGLTVGTTGGVSGVLIPSASVFDVATPNGATSGTYSLLVSIEVPTSAASAVATAAGAGQVSLVLLARDGASTVASSSPRVGR